LPWITDDDLKTRVLSLLGKTEFETSGVYETVITDANRQAYRDILFALTSRGYSVAQVEAWDAKQEFNVSLGLFWALTMLGAAKNFDDRFIKALDRREELTDPRRVIRITSGGVTVTPSGVRTVSVKKFKEKKNEVFTAEKMDKW
jgi:hypothetical protein